MGDERVNGTTQTTQSTTQSAHGKKLSDVEKAIVDAMRKNSKISQSQMAEQMGMDVNTIKYYVRSLSKDNIIKRNGNNRSGEWVVLH